MYEIYVVTNVTNGKKYVGQTRKTIRIRWAQHLTHARQGTRVPFHFAIRKYGEDAFTVEQVAVCETLEWANYLEKTWVLLLNTTNRKFGYNATFGGDGGLVGDSLEKMRIALQGHPVSTSTRALIGERAKERAKDPVYRAMLSETNTGKQHTEQGKAAISAALQNNQYRKDIPHSDEIKLQISLSVKLAYAEGRHVKGTGLKKGTVLGPMSEQEKLKRSLGMKGYIRTPEHEAKRVSAHRTVFDRKREPKALEALFA